MADWELRRALTDASDFVALVQKLDRLLTELNGPSDPFYSQHNRIETPQCAVVASLRGAPVGCGAFRAVDEDTVEIKRMFVEADSRGNGVGAAILAELEAWAAELGHTHAVLETSKRLTPAVKLYTRAGFVRIDNYGPYVGVDDSVCFRKTLGGTTSDGLAETKQVLS